MKSNYNVEKYLVFETKTKLCSDEFEALIDEIQIYEGKQ